MKKRLITILLSLALITTMMPAMAMTAEAATDPLLAQPLCFTALEGNSNVKIISEGTKTLNFQYSYDSQNWFDYKISTDILLKNTNDKVYFRAKGTNDAVTDLMNYIYRFQAAGSLKLSGNILSLLYQTGFENKANEALPATAFAGLFAECLGIKDASDLKLPSTELSDGCYMLMFSECQNLTKAPDLPSTTLAAACYENMFYACKYLATAPELPAMQMQPYCYDHMFWGCKSLVNAPKLPATELAEYCYNYMFSYCEALKIAPLLPATELAYGCYYEMFSKCSSLEELAVRFEPSAIEGYSLNNWLGDASESATIYAPPSLQGHSCIPEGWTFVDIAEYDKMHPAQNDKCEKIKDAVYLVVGIATVTTTAAIIASMVKKHFTGKASVVSDLIKSISKLSENKLLKALNSLRQL